MMKFLKNGTLAIAFIAILLCGCKKAEVVAEQKKIDVKAVEVRDEEPDPGDPFPPTGPDIEALKIYMAEVTNVNVGDIDYNYYTDQFSIYGQDQINLADLNARYEGRQLNSESF